MPLYDKLNVFVSQLYPDYGPNSFMRTPVVKMTAGDYLYRQPGFLNSINLSIEQDYPWELESGDGSYCTNNEPLITALPEYGKGSVTFKA